MAQFLIEDAALHALELTEKLEQRDRDLAEANAAAIANARAELAADLGGV